jgi:acetyl-CoA carboxylase biotin carboxyl carrier protein
MAEKITVSAPMPGVFYRRPDPEDPPFVEAGEDVEEGEVVGLIGVMKNFHDITAEADGTVTEFFVENETEVDAGDELLVLEVA